MISCFFAQLWSLLVFFSSLFYARPEFFFSLLFSTKHIVVKICTTIVNSKNDYGRLSHTIKQEHSSQNPPRFPRFSNLQAILSLKNSNYGVSSSKQKAFLLLCFSHPMSKISIYIFEFALSK